MALRLELRERRRALVQPPPDAADTDPAGDQLGELGCDQGGDVDDRRDLDRREHVGLPLQTHELQPLDLAARVVGVRELRPLLQELEPGIDEGVGVDLEPSRKDLRSYAVFNIMSA